MLSANKTTQKKHVSLGNQASPYKLVMRYKTTYKHLLKHCATTTPTRARAPHEQHGMVLCLRHLIKTLLVVMCKVNTINQIKCVAFQKCILDVCAIQSLGDTTVVTRSEKKPTGS